MLRIALLVFITLAAYSQTAKVKFVVGKVEVQRTGTTTWEAVRPTTTFNNGDQVRTAFESRVSIQTPDKTLIRLGQNSILTLNSIKKVGDKKTSNKLKLWGGRLWAKFTKLFSDEEENTISTPTAVAAIRGTTLETIYDESNEETTFKLLEGRIEVRNNQGGSTNLNGGQKATVEKDGNTQTETLTNDDQNSPLNNGDNFKNEDGSSDDDEIEDTGNNQDEDNQDGDQDGDQDDDDQNDDTQEDDSDGDTTDDDNSDTTNEPEDSSPNFLNMDQTSGTISAAQDVANGLLISGTTKKTARLTVNGQVATVGNDGFFQITLPLGEGVHRIAITSTEKYGTINQNLNIKINTSEPELFVDNSESDLFSTEPLYNLGIQVTDLTPQDLLSVNINGKVVKTGPSPLNSTESIQLRSGLNNINITVRDEVGHTDAKSIQVFYDGDAPEIQIYSGIEDIIPTTSFGELPPGIPGFPFRVQSRQIFGTVVDKVPSSGIKELVINGEKITVRNDGSFTYFLDLDQIRDQLVQIYNENRISGGEFFIPLQIEVEDNAGNRYTENSYQIRMVIPRFGQ